IVTRMNDDFECFATAFRDTGFRPTIPSYLHRRPLLYSSFTKEALMKSLTRRQALTGVATGMMIVKPDTAFGYQANSAVSFGVIGTGGRGVYVGTHMANVTGTRLAAICDVFADRIDNGKTKIPGGAAARVYRDYHE